MISFDNVYMNYQHGQEALNGVTFDLAAGEFAFLTGHSGAGKSTLLKLCALIERSNQGNIYVNDIHYNKVKRREIPYLRRNIGIIFQDPHLLNGRTAFDNVALPLHIGGYTGQEMGRRVHAALDKVGLLSKQRMYPQELSSGEQQRLGIARAVVNRPSLLLADEPTGNLDPELSAEIMQLFQQFNQVGVSVLVASHDLALIAKLKHRIITLKKGRLYHG